MCSGHLCLGGEFISVLESVFLSGVIGWRVAAPIFREFSAVFLSAAIYKDCKARDIRKRFWWTFFALASPVIAFVSYVIYSRFINSNTSDSLKKLSFSAKSKILLTISAFSYFVSLLILMISVVVTVSSGIAGIGKGEIPLSHKYYDRNNIEYASVYDVPLYDKNGHEYHHITKNLIFYGYIDENGNEYFDDVLLISQTGFVMFESSDELSENDAENCWYDSSGIKYKEFTNWIYWNEDGIIINYAPKSSFPVF